MKTAGGITVIVGLLMTMYTGFSYITREKVIDMWGLEVSKDNEHNVNWQPYIGIATMITGGAVIAMARKKSPAA
jgi:hypothetical protein